MIAGVTPLWHLERKTRIHYVNLTGSLAMLFQLERKPELHVSTKEEA